jgi:hypothetical protein
MSLIFLFEFSLIHCLLAATSLAQQQKQHETNCVFKEFSD